MLRVQLTLLVQPCHAVGATGLLRNRFASVTAAEVGIVATTFHDPGSTSTTRHRPAESHRWVTSRLPARQTSGGSRNSTSSVIGLDPGFGYVRKSHRSIAFAGPRQLSRFGRPRGGAGAACFPMGVGARRVVRASWAAARQRMTGISSSPRYAHAGYDDAASLGDPGTGTVDDPVTEIGRLGFRRACLKSQFEQGSSESIVPR